MHRLGETSHSFLPSQYNEAVFHLAESKTYSEWYFTDVHFKHVIQQLEISRNAGPERVFPCLMFKGPCIVIYFCSKTNQIPTREINKISSTEMDVLRRSARKSRLERIKNVHIKEIMGVKEKPDIIDIIERKRLQWYGHVKRMQGERLPKLIMEWIPVERRKRGRPRKTWMEGVRAAMKTRYLEADQWLNRKEWCLGSGRRRQLS
jgi:hypothetical protein